MGVRLLITVYSDSEEAAGKAIEKAVEKIKKCNRIFSNYSANSEVAQLVRQSHTTPISVSPELFFLLTRAQEINETTKGAFDITLGRITKLWREARRNRKLPETPVLTAALANAGMQHLTLNVQDHTVRVNTDLELDFGGIAKGYAADLALASLRQDGIPIALVDLGGDLAVGDPPPRAVGWNIAIAPLQKSDPISRFISVSNCGLATSGDTEQYVDIEGVRYSHILDPQTGLGLQRRSSVTVFAKNATQADALASAYSVMSLADSRAHASELAFKAGFLVQEKVDGAMVESIAGDFPQIRIKK